MVAVSVNAEPVKLHVVQQVGVEQECIITIRGKRNRNAKDVSN